MVNGQKYYYMTEVGAEILMFITCLVIAFCALWLNLQSVIGSIGDKFASLLLSSSYALFLPLMSYMYSQTQQYKLEVRAQTILFWMVIIEIMRILGDSTWELRKSLEQLVRLFWVGYLICSYPHLQGIRLSLLILCIGSTVHEILKGIRFNKAKDEAAPAAQAAQAGPSNQQLMDYMVELSGGTRNDR
ncbi:hypothetical protein FCM35_KLT19746 [Carex littledalei]|uniref:Uncharacterized protein n=1 Tax=Carex littledalei TaxID=544730 RepID=A0A833RHH5_9POAL|nr:hypothetical protein FCM35_KLT19746 [Carex littledalei]